jgi:hypothetical protein
VSKDKKKKKKDKKNGGADGSLTSATKSLKAISENPLVADIVAAALVGAAAALKDSRKARRLAADAGDQLDAMSKEAANRGNAMWDLALDVGRRTLDALATEATAKKKR